MVANGVLHASALSLLRKHVTPENARELFDLCKKKSARKVEELLAARFPRPDVRDLVRRLPARAVLALDVECGSENESTIVPSREPSRESQREPSCEPMQKAFFESPSREPPAASGPSEITAPSKGRRLEPLSADRYGVHFTANGEFRELLERVRGLAGHRLPEGDLMTLIKRGLEAYERELTKERFALGRRPRRSPDVDSALSARDLLTKDISEASETSEAPEASVPATADLSASDLLERELSAPERPKCDPQTKTRPNPHRHRRWHCPAAVARAVFLRDGQQCSFVSSDGRRCSARRWLELDHVDPRAAGGEDTIGNLRLRCHAHN